MRRLLAVGCALVLAGWGSAAAQDWSRARTVSVALTSHRFAPDRLRLTPGQPVILHLVNSSDEDHDFTSPRFLNAAQIDRSQRRMISGGRIRVPARRTVDVRLVPAAGRYELRCSERFHSSLGARGEIIVR